MSAENTEKGIGILERVLNITKKYSLLEIFKAVILMVIMVMVIQFSFNPEKVFEVYDSYKERLHDEGTSQRKMYSPLIQEELQNLVDITGADRCLFLEYHNGKVSSGGLPFEYAHATFEAVADGIVSVADQYDEVSLTLFPFALHLSKMQYYHGDVSSLKDMDKKLMYKLMSNDVEHFAMKEVVGVNKPLGILILTYTHIDDYNCEFVKHRIEKTSASIAVKLELDRK